MTDNYLGYVMSGLVFISVKGKHKSFHVVKDLETNRQIVKDYFTRLEKATVISLAYDMVQNSLIRIEDHLLGIKPRCYVGDLAFGWLYAVGDHSFDVVVDVEGCDCSEEKWLLNPNAAWKVYDRKQWGVACKDD